MCLLQISMDMLYKGSSMGWTLTTTNVTLYVGSRGRYYAVETIWARGQGTDRYNALMRCGRVWLA